MKKMTNQNSGVEYGKLIYTNKIYEKTDNITWVNVWLPQFEDVQNRVNDANDPGSFQAVDCVGLNQAGHICAVSGDGRLLHTVLNLSKNKK